MISIPPLPEWRDFKKLFQPLNAQMVESWSGGTSFPFLLSRTSFSFVLIIQWYIAATKKSQVILWIPDYFCNATLQSLKQMKEVQLFYYPITKNLEPDWDICKNMVQETSPDLFVFVHYFGVGREINRAKTFCKNNSSLLVEDCAHSLYAKDKMGSQGDFSVFSLHKLFALPDGAVLNCNEANLMQKGYEITQINLVMKQLYEKLLPFQNNWKWLMKRVLQKLILLRPILEITTKELIGTDERKQIKLFKISSFSAKLLQNYDAVKIRRMEQIRKQNLKVLNAILQEASKEIIPIFKEHSEAPYLGVYSLENVTDKEGVLKKLQKQGFLLQKWPDLPPELNLDPQLHQQALERSRNLITLPIHQSISVSKLLHLSKRAQKIKQESTLIQIQWNQFTKEQWNTVYEQIPKSTLTQDWYYGEAKKAAEHWKVERGLIYQNGQVIGLVQVLEKICLGLHVARINRGPLFLPAYSSAAIMQSVLLCLQKKYNLFHRKILFMMPEITFDYEFCRFFEQQHFRRRASCCYSSAWVSLQEKEEALRAQLKSKWRNQLKNAEKKGFEIKEYKGDYHTLLEKYQMFQQEKNFGGIPMAILKYFFDFHSSSLYVISVYSKEHKLVGFDIAYLHGVTATYLVGWLNEEGRAGDANNLMLFYLMLHVKKKGIQYFDVGGIDDVYTLDIAKFKRGLAGEEYELIGEYFMVL